MAENSAISWTDHTFSPWHGCIKISPGCQHCYAETLSARWGKQVWGPTNLRAVVSDNQWKQPLKWNRDAAFCGVRARVFCGSMCDVFEDRRECVEPRQRLGKLILCTPNLDWLLLTKRPENWTDACKEMFIRSDDSYPLPPNVSIGVSAENQEYAEERIIQLLNIPAAVRFVSYEPSLGGVDFTRLWLPDRSGFWNALTGKLTVKVNCDSGQTVWAETMNPLKQPLDWIIAGGESGSNRRPCEIQWFADAARQCAEAGIAFHMKQDAARSPGQQGRIPLPLWQLKQFPHPKGE